MTRPPSSARAGLVLALVGLGAAVLATATSFVLTTRLFSEDALRSDMDTILTSVSEEIVANTDAYLRPAAQTADFLSDVIESGATSPGEADAIDSLLLSILRANETFDGLYVGGADGSFVIAQRTGDLADPFELKRIGFEDGKRLVTIAAYGPDLSLLRSTPDPSDTYDPRVRTWYEDVAETEGDVWTDPYVFFASGNLGVTRASPVYQEGELEYVVGIDIRINQLSEFIAERAPSPNGSSFLLTSEGLLVAYPDLDVISDGTTLRYADDINDPAARFAAEALRQQQLAEAPISSTPELEGEQTQFILTPLESTDWTAATWSPSSDFLAAVRDTRRTNMMIALGLGLTILAALLAAALWVRRSLRANEGLLEASEAASDRAETELAEANEKLQASNRELEQYAYAAAHDLRTPLRAIGGYGELISRESESEQPDLNLLRRWAGQILTGYERMGQTMDKLLEHAQLSKFGPTEESFTVVDTTAVAHTVLGDFRSTLEEVGGTAEIGPLPLVRGDANRLGRVFQNLVENAIRFRSPDRPLHVKITGTLDGSIATFRVQDNGSGIHDVNRQRIFEAFNKAGDSNGLGLGLALVKRVVEDHGGAISAESQSGSGTTIAFTLPAVETNADRAVSV